MPGLCVGVGGIAIVFFVFTRCGVVSEMQEAIAQLQDSRLKNDAMPFLVECCQ